jgi:hypothetical protein
MSLSISVSGGTGILGIGNVNLEGLSNSEQVRTIGKFLYYKGLRENWREVLDKE